jgi:hypothetical protein
MPNEKPQPRDEATEERTLDLSLLEIETLHALVEAKVEGVLVHSEEYFRLQDIAFKLASARKLSR